jgi:hypothetical protein
MNIKFMKLVVLCPMRPYCSDSSVLILSKAQKLWIAQIHVKGEDLWRKMCLIQIYTCPKGVELGILGILTTESEKIN